MPVEHTPVYPSLVSLGGSGGQIVWNSGTQIQSQILDARDVASVGNNDFASANTIGQSQIWWISYSILFISIAGGALNVAAGRNLSVTLRNWYSAAGPVSAFGPENVVYLPFDAPQNVSGRFRVESDGAQIVFDNATGANFNLWWRAWAKAE